MVRLLIIGRPAASRASQLAALGFNQLEVDHARLPAAGIRQLEATPPDAVLIADDRGDRISLLVEALRSRPIGGLLTILVISPTPQGLRPEEAADLLGVEAWLRPEATDEEIVDTLVHQLGVQRSDLNVERSASVTAAAAAALLDSEGIAEPRHDHSQSAPSPPAQDVRKTPVQPATRVDHRTFCPSRHEVPRREGGVDGEAIRRKLRAVRHEDYYAILEVRRGADGTAIRDAYQRLMRRFDPSGVETGVAHDFLVEPHEIHDALEDAWAVLGDADLRETYLAYTLRH